MDHPAIMTIDHRGPATLRSRLVNLLLMPWMRRSFAALAQATFGPELLARTARIDGLAVRFPLPWGTRTRPGPVMDFGCEWVFGARVESEADGVIVYLHGGGWCFGGLNTHRALISRISAAAGVPALSVDYRMVPEVTFAEEVGDCVAAYRRLLEEGWAPDQVVIMGDSAGGHLAFAAALRARDEGLPVPGGIVSLSGALDLDLSRKREHPNSRLDPMRALEAFTVLVEGVTQGLDVRHPSVSPLRADLGGLPPSLLTAGSNEVVYCDSEEMAHRLVEAGVPTTLQAWDRQMHVFQAFAPFIPEATRAIREIGSFVRRVLVARRPTGELADEAS